MTLFSQDELEIFPCCLHTLNHYNKLFPSDQKYLKFTFHFKCKYILQNSELLISCQSCIDEYFGISSNSDSVERIKTCFMIYLIEKEDYYQTLIFLTRYHLRIKRSFEI